MTTLRVGPADAALVECWRAAWPLALDAWSRYTRLHDPRLCATTVAAAKEGLQGSFAMIRLLDQSVVIDLESVRAHGLEDYGVEIMAHEIGHHVLAPGTALDHFRLIARIRRVLPSVEDDAALVANLYTDLCINDRLQRQANLRMAAIYRTLARPAGAAVKESTRLWCLYMRIYEHLWQLDKGYLVTGKIDDVLEADAWLGARLIRVYASDWMTGGARFATLILPYLLEGKDPAKRLRIWLDTGSACQGCTPDGLLDHENEERDGVLHPLYDPALSGDDARAPQVLERIGRAKGQLREPFEFGAILKAGGVNLSDHAIAMRYYRERALPHLVAFPTRPQPRAPEPEMEGLEPWEIGDPLDSIDWLGTLALSPRPVPGVTTVRRTFSEQPSSTHAPFPLDLDLYVDSSGSMPNPQVATSYLTLAAAIVALSAMRAGASVQATLWSGVRQVIGTQGFVRDSDEVLRVLTGYFGGATAFPIHRLRDTWDAAAPRKRAAHILMISDDGITTMFDSDEQGNSGWDVGAAALKSAGGGGTMALNLPVLWEQEQYQCKGSPYPLLRRARDSQGWDIHAISDMAQLVAFARAFSALHYGKPR